MLKSLEGWRLLHKTSGRLPDFYSAGKLGEIERAMQLLYDEPGGTHGRDYRNKNAWQSKSKSVVLAMTENTKNALDKR